jgi:hypothetical protein
MKNSEILANCAGGIKIKEEWKNKRESFELMDVRKLSGNFLLTILKKADKVAVGDGICVVQSFEPIPLYSAMADLGFEYQSEKVSDDEYRVYFHRTEMKEASVPGGMNAPLKPLAILNLKEIDNALAETVVHFWDIVWGQENPAIEMKTRLLLSLANGVLESGSGILCIRDRSFTAIWCLPVDQEIGEKRYVARRCDKEVDRRVRREESRRENDLHKEKLKREKN